MDSFGPWGHLDLPSLGLGVSKHAPHDPRFFSGAPSQLAGSCHPAHHPCVAAPPFLGQPTAMVREAIHREAGFDWNRHQILCCLDHVMSLAFLFLAIFLLHLSFSCNDVLYCDACYCNSTEQNSEIRTAPALHITLSYLLFLSKFAFCQWEKMVSCS